MLNLGLVGERGLGGAQITFYKVWTTGGTQEENWILETKIAPPM